MAIVDNSLEYRQVDLFESYRHAWEILASEIRDFDADFVILVARKMPRLVEALQLDLGAQAICVSDQAIPFIHRELKNRRIAIVDDIWNVGTTMRRVRERVESVQPRGYRMFALGARDASSARNENVFLAYSGSLSLERYESLVESVPKLLRQVPKPYDADFPVVPCLLIPPFTEWADCWQWLRSKFGANVHAVYDKDQIDNGYPRATVNLLNESGWSVKARLYFDLPNHACNVVPMALAPALTSNIDTLYPPESVSARVFSILKNILDGNNQLPVDEVRDGFARAVTFCDALLFTDMILESLEDFVKRETFEPYSVKDIAVQFGRLASENCEKCNNTNIESINITRIVKFLSARSETLSAKQQLMIDDPRVSEEARDLLVKGSATLAFEALFKNLGKVVGAERPEDYLLTEPYSRDEVLRNPYLRLRIGFTFQEMLNFFQNHLKTRFYESTPELILSKLLDTFIDLGAVVPTITLHGNQSFRVYRKGEANPRFDEIIDRFQYALNNLSPEIGDENQELSPTRASKILSILAFSGMAGDCVRPGSLERGSVAMLRPSVVESYPSEITMFMKKIGRSWGKGSSKSKA